MAKRPKIKMSAAKRAKLFMPYDALDGLRAALKREEKEHEYKLLMLQEGEDEPDETAEKYGEVTRRPGWND